ncbi:CPBP family intramembrane metalloprotease [Bacteroidales bacterium OttesenSCG-928-M06]|nr:CPBP family intramembrane metalloprotease [Bacteroidales bacterium OttesenSCG-928-M06]
MLLKGLFNDSSAWVQFIVFLALIIGGMIGCTLITQLLIVIRFGLSPEVIEHVITNLIHYPELIRNIQFFQGVIAFIFPSIICAWLFSDNYKSYLKADVSINIPTVGLTILSIIIFIPFINWTQIINQQLVLPEWLEGLEKWMQAQEETNAEILKKMLYSKTIWTLLFNILIVCILTGIGEEFIFRGILQNIFGRAIKNPHIVIWLVAIIFSAIHLQFYGFIPRMLLGAYFGYLLLYTRNIWMPVIAHITHNLINVIGFYIYQDSPHMESELDTLGVGDTSWLALASFALFVFIFMQIKQRGPKSQSFSS